MLARALILGARGVRTRSVHFCSRARPVTCNPSHPHRQEWAPKFGPERQLRDHGPPPAEDSRRGRRAGRALAGRGGNDDSFDLHTLFLTSATGVVVEAPSWTYRDPGALARCARPPPKAAPRTPVAPTRTLPPPSSLITRLLLPPPLLSFSSLAGSRRWRHVAVAGGWTSTWSSSSSASTGASTCEHSR